MERVDRYLNILTAIAGLATLAVAVQLLRGLPSDPQLPQGPHIGSHLTVSGISWSDSSGSLLMAISTNCHFCVESGAFYKELGEKLEKNGRVRLIAVAPDSELFVDRLGIKVAVSIKEPIFSVGATVTPTLLYVNNQGEIKNVWVGRLTPKQEKEVFAVIGT